MEIDGPGQIRYTLDGSMPDPASPLYTGPIELTKTTVVRAACFEEDKDIYLPEFQVWGASIVTD